MDPKKKTPKTRKTKNKLPELGYNVRRLSDYTNITNNNKTKSFVFMNALRAIKDGVSSGKTQVGLVQLKGSKTSVLLDKRDWKSTLDNAITFFAEHEMYETCQECMNVLNTL